jgi:hypothetical protein
MLIEQNAGNHACDYDPRELTTITLDGEPVRTLARRVDGAFPSTTNPIAVWEVKEYYYTTTFGSRVADGVYESLLDGMELEELREHENIDVRHYLMVDAHFTWWTCGKAYLCRLVDMLHMGYVDEILFGDEVVDELPRIAPVEKELNRSDGRRLVATPVSRGVKQHSSWFRRRLAPGLDLRTRRAVVLAAFQHSRRPTPARDTYDRRRTPTRDTYAAWRLPGTPMRVLPRAVV